MANKKAIIITSSVAVLVVAGALIAGPILNNKFGDSKNDSMSGMDHSKMNMSSSSSDSLVQKDSDDYKQYAALTGDDYDKAFIANMIVHHEGAVDMAKLALTNASRQEIKDMANDIISAQTGEITEMVGTIQASTAQVVTRIDEGVSAVGRSVAHARDAGESIESLLAIARQVSELISDIDLALREQAEASNDVARTVEQIASNAEEIHTVTTETRRSAEALQAMAGRMQGNVSRFSL